MARARVYLNLIKLIKSCTAPMTRIYLGGAMPYCVCVSVAIAMPFFSMIVCGIETYSATVLTNHYT